LVTVGVTLSLYSIELPPPSGPFAVGRKSYAWTDSARAETWIDDAAARRQLVIYIWYPANQTAGSRTTPYYPELRDLNNQFKRYERFAIGSVRSRILADAELAPAPDRFPVLLFSPGANNSSHFYTSLLEELASHGYVVVAIEHTYEGRGQVFPDGRVVGPESTREQPRPDSPTLAADIAQFHRRRVDVRARDAAFVLDELARIGENDPLLGGRLDLSRVGIFGHSLGGIAASEAARQDKRFRAVANLDGLVNGQPMYPEPVGQGLGSPFLYLGKSLREEIKAKQDEVLRSVKGGSYRVLIEGANHESFSDSPFWAPGNRAGKCKTVAAVRAYLLAFFGRHLLGQSTDLFDGPPAAFSGATVESFFPAPR
jgi:dienelactone hydrolase